MFRMYARRLLCAATLLLSIAPALAQGIAEDGKDEFEAKCSKCHSVDPAAGPGTGPNLHGVVGTTAGAKPGFGFSDALKASGLTWTDANLVRFIENPGATVPGNKMAGSYMGTTAEIATDIVAYLKTLTAASPAP
jgi:cytochrome c